MAPVEVKGDYDVIVKFSPRGVGCLSITLPVGSHNCLLRFDASGRPGLYVVDEREWHDEATTNRVGTLTDGQRYTALVKVRLQKQLAAIEAFLDDARYPLAREGIVAQSAQEWFLPPQRLGFGVAGSQATFYSVKLRMVSGKAWWLEPKGP